MQVDNSSMERKPIQNEEKENELFYPDEMNLIASALERLYLEIFGTKARGSFLMRLKYPYDEPHDIVELTLPSGAVKGKDVNSDKTAEELMQDISIQHYDVAGFVRSCDGAISTMILPLTGGTLEVNHFHNGMGSGCDYEILMGLAEIISYLVPMDRILRTSLNQLAAPDDYGRSHMRQMLLSRTIPELRVHEEKAHSRKMAQGYRSLLI